MDKHSPARPVRDRIAIVLASFGLLLCGVGWAIGALLLWTSPRFSSFQKLVGTLALPLGWGACGALLAFSTGPGSEAILIVAALGLFISAMNVAFLA